MSLLTQCLQQPYRCYCGEDLALASEEIKKHLSKCNKFQKQSAIFLKIEECLHNSNNLEKLCEFKAVLDFFSYFAEIKIGELILETTHQLQQNIYETKFNLLGSTSLLTTTQKLNQKLLFKQNECHSCKQFKDQSVLFCLGQCYQQICKECISKCINNNLHQGFEKIPCSCGKLFEKQDLKQYLGEEYQTFLKKLQQLLTFTCKSCKITKLVKVGYEIFGLKDPVTNKLLNKTYLEHYRFNQVKCPGCSTSQCRKCQAIPYHLGKNCEEFHQEANQKLCRYCESLIPIADINVNLPEAQRNICKKVECSNKIKTVCSKLLPCKHPCFGFANEVECPPCLETKCSVGSQVKEQKTDFCSICYTEQLNQLPIVRSKCGHIFHYECVVKLLENKWTGPRIVLNFCYCPQCREWLQFPPCPLEEELQKYLKLFSDIQRFSLDRLELEGRMNDEALVNKDRDFYNSPLEYALSIYCYYQCYKCKNPYFGGLKDCQMGLEEDKQKFNPSELVCSNCCEVVVGESCPQHGKEYSEYKCKFCCTVAMWFCWGTTHFCDDCHKRQCSGDYLSKYSIDKLPKCQGVDKCPLKIAHKPNGEEFLIGCSKICLFVEMPKQMPRIFDSLKLLILNKNIMSQLTQCLQQPYRCYCREDLALASEEIKKHLSKCNKFQKQSAIFLKIEECLHNSNNLEKLYEFKAVLDFFSYFTEIQIGELILETTHRLQQNIFETKFNLLGSTSLLTTTQKLNQKLLFKQNECHSCKQFKDQSVLFCLGQCYQQICKECISKCINNNLHQGFEKIPCSCGKLFEKQDLKQYLGEEYQTFLKKLQQLLTFTCKSCKITKLVKVGQEIFELKDPVTKKQLNKTYLENYRFNQVKCPGCSTSQCRKCQAIPYHLGKNCEEFHQEANQILCRYCESLIPIADINVNLPEAQRNICKKVECSNKIKTVCSKLLPCKHPCFGFANEVECPPCLETKCSVGSQVKEQKTDFCSICYTEQLNQLPIVRSKCGHIFHYECVVKLLENKWTGPRIVLNFCYCPQCREWLQFPPCPLEEELQKYLKLFSDIQRFSLDRLELEGRMNDEALVNKDRDFYNSPLEYALSIYCYYQCYKCKNPYFGGLKDCQMGLEEDKQKFNPSELVCSNCCEVVVGESCPQHGKEYSEYKCKFCCTVAMWFCWGTTHFCDDCHKRQCSGDYLSKYSIDKLPKCQGVDKCPLKIAHKPNGEEFLIGCTICRNAKANAKNF